MYKLYTKILFSGMLYLSCLLINTVVVLNIQEAGLCDLCIVGDSDNKDKLSFLSNGFESGKLNVNTSHD